MEDSDFEKHDVQISRERYKQELASLFAGVMDDSDIEDMMY